MKRLIACMIVSCLLGLGAVRAEARKIVLASSEYPPYFGKQLPNFGGISEIVVAAYRRVGYDVEIQFYPWARALDMTKNGKCDGMFAVWKTQERTQWFVYSDPLPENEIGFFKRRADRIRFTSMADLRVYRIGTVRGYANPSVFEQTSDLKKEEVTEDIQNLTKLAANRIDLALIDKGLAYYLLSTALPDERNNLTWLGPAIEFVPQYMVISRKSADAQGKIDDFNRGLAIITKEGLVRSIRAKHGF